MSEQQAVITKEAAVERYKAIQNAVFRVIEFDENLQDFREQKQAAITALHNFLAERSDVSDADDLYEVMVENARLQAVLTTAEEQVETTIRVLARAIDALHDLADGLPVNQLTFGSTIYHTNLQEIWVAGRSEPITTRRWVFDD